MDYYKSSLFTKKQQKQASTFKALSHPARLAILEYLASKKTCISGDITQEIPLSRTTVNQHLTELKNAGLIKGEISGSKTNYCLDRKNIIEHKMDVMIFFKNLESASNTNC